MNDRGVLALRVAHAADLILMPIDHDAHRLRQIGPVLEYGEHACVDEIVTIACRHRLAAQGEFDEVAVIELVAHYGFTYVGRQWVAAGPLATRPPQSSRMGLGVNEPSCA